MKKKIFRCFYARKYEFSVFAHKYFVFAHEILGFSCFIIKKNILSSCITVFNGFTVFFSVKKHHILNIDIKGYNGPSEAVVFDIAGQIILNKKMESRDAKLNVSALAAGVYFVKISAEDKTLTMTKIIKRD
jgi:hypothetical protein